MALLYKAMKTKHQLNLYLTPELITRLRTRAAQETIRQGRTVKISELARISIESYLDPSLWQKKYEELFRAVTAAGALLDTAPEKQKSDISIDGDDLF